MFEKGNKLGGRKEGSINNVTRNVKNSFQYLLENNLNQLQDDLDKMKPETRFQCLMQLAKFIIPNAVKAEAKDVSQVPIIINLGEGVNPDSVN